MLQNAYAKLNLYLNINGLLPDGFHELTTVMQQITLCDEISVNRAEDTVIKTDKPYIPTDSRNTAFKAARVFFEETGINGGAEIFIKKKIPVGAGMAGGSADAAVVLTQLNMLYKSPLSQAELLKAGLKVGADVPFCMTGGTALCKGKGEIISPLRRIKGCVFAVVKPSFSVSTPAAYNEYDRVGGDCPQEEGILAAIENGGTADICNGMGNALEKGVCALHPEINEIKRKLIDLGAMGSMMTGSGSAVFGVFETAAQAKNAAAKLKGRDTQTFFAYPR